MAGNVSGPRRSDRSPWNWLFIIPVVVPLLTFVFNRSTPRLAGFPFFYWVQFSFVILGVGCTTIVYVATRDPRTGPHAPKKD